MEGCRIAQSLPIIHSAITASCWINDVDFHIPAMAVFAIGCADGTVGLYLKKEGEVCICFTLICYQILTTLGETNFGLAFVAAISGPVEDLVYQASQGKLAAVGGGDVRIWTIFYPSTASASLVSQKTHSIKADCVANNIHFIAKSTVLVSFLESGDM
jgi:hypothetical protein